MICFDYNIGIARTSKAIASKYYWENAMHSDVISTIKACQSCQKSKPRLKKHLEDYTQYQLPQR